MPRNPRGLNITNKPAMDEKETEDIFTSFASSSSTAGSSWSFDDIEEKNKNNTNSKSISPKK
jgi:hypothetical protein